MDSKGNEHRMNHNVNVVRSAFGFPMVLEQLHNFRNLNQHLKGLVQYNIRKHKCGIQFFEIKDKSFEKPAHVLWLLTKVEPMDNHNVIWATHLAQLYKSKAHTTNWAEFFYAEMKMAYFIFSFTLRLDEKKRWVERK